MNNSEFEMLEDIIIPIDPVKILNQYASYSTFKEDIIFNKNNITFPIFCGGVIKEFGHHVYNLKKNELVGYLSCKKALNIELSSNLVFKITESKSKLLFILPYASYAMKILRIINPKLSQNIVLIGFNFFSYLLYKIFKISGANVYIIKLEEDTDLFEVDDKDLDFINNKLKIIIRNRLIDKVLLLTKLNDKIINILNVNNENIIEKKIYHLTLDNVIKKKKIFEFIYISKFDAGLLDSNYIQGVKYPFPYVRWDYKKNLEYFINLIEINKIDIDFLDVLKINVNSMEEMNEKINQIQEKSLILFYIQN